MDEIKWSTVFSRLLDNKLFSSDIQDKKKHWKEMIFGWKHSRKNPLNSIGFFKLVYIFYYPWYHFFLYNLFSLKRFYLFYNDISKFSLSFSFFFLTMESEPKIFRFQWASVFCCCFFVEMSGWGMRGGETKPICTQLTRVHVWIHNRCFLVWEQWIIGCRMMLLLLMFIFI